MRHKTCKYTYKIYKLIAEGNLEDIAPKNGIQSKAAYQAIKRDGFMYNENFFVKRELNYQYREVNQ